MGTTKPYRATRPGAGAPRAGTLKPTRTEAPAMRTRVPPFSRSEFTGENRCWPCTVLNALLVAACCLALGRRRRGLAVLAAAVGAAAIYARGYVVPYTPRFAPRLAAALGVQSGHRGPPEGVKGNEGSLLAATGRDGEEEAGEELFGTLLGAGVLDTDGGAVVLSRAVEERWEREMATLRELDDGSLAAAALDASAATDAWSATDGPWGPMGPDERRYVVLSVGADSAVGETWLSRPVAIAETAAVRALDGAVGDAGTRRAAASAMRVFLETCPDCTTPLRETTTAACCGGSMGSSTRPHEVLACPECDVSLHQFD